MDTCFTADFFAHNRRRLRKLAGETPIVISGNGLMQRGADEPSAFHQDSSFWYLTGLNAPDLILVMLADREYVIVPSMSATREAFDGAHDVAAYQARSGIAEFVGEREGWGRLKGHRTVATLAPPPVHWKAHGIYGLPFRRRLLARLKRLNPGLAVIDIRPELAGLRSVKQPAELRALQRAIDITGQTLAEIAEQVLPDAQHEYELDAALGYGFRRRGAEGHAFAPIVGAGQHGTTLHYLENSGPIAPGDLVVLDVGAQFEHYAADITRTVSRQPITGRKAEVFKAVEAVQDFALEHIEPDMVMRQYEQAVEAEMGRQLHHLGLVTNPSDHAAIRHYFPHATSHFLGLDTHDVGDYQQPLQPNMVITCEPGIYIPEEGIGIRIEDDVLITPDGHKVLSAACPRRLTSVE